MVLDRLDFDDFFLLSFTLSYQSLFLWNLAKGASKGVEVQPLSLTRKKDGDNLRRKTFSFDLICFLKLIR